ncbi:hypothetical protein KORDIASMS9_03642 [Kordia sp. SMS9]|uniref:hypothetical protein n=1 Tax=Kordia sp. SMS9 TaxID=2282170 RepID=UPI000E0CF9BB|nr:hypothetical protein [Kordia sp. SMS9]AXG71385.1 hypothetical protein KORDIASMS9_03642 [Kordia sp. SMS9]
MNIINALYGSQYSELKNKSYDVNKGRFYGNLLLTAIIIIYLFIAVIILNFISEDILDDLLKPLRRMFGRSMGKAASQIVAIPLIVVIYLIVMLLFGSKKRYEKSYQIYDKASKEEKDSAMGKLIGIFLIGFLSLVILGITSLFL